MKDPENEFEFEEICYDSNDDDFQHEYDILALQNEDDSPMQIPDHSEQRLSEASCDSTYYNKLADNINQEYA